MDNPPFVLPANPPDEGDFVYIGFSKDWLPFVIGGLLAFRDNSNWVDGEENDAEGQVDTLINLLMINLDPPP